MRKQKSKTLWFGKILLVLLMIFSQMYAPIEVLAEELNNNETTQINETVDNNVELQNEKKETANESADTVVENKQEDTNELVSENNTPQEVTEENVSSEESTPEDTTEATKTYTYKIFINEEEVEEFTISSDNKQITIKQQYDGEEGTYHFSNPNETEVIDFTNKLYGTYKKEYKVLSNEEEELDAKSITINYEGDNNEILENYTNGTSYTSVHENTIEVDGTNKYLKVGDILSKFNLTKLKEEYDATLVAKDENGNTLSNEEDVTDKVKFILTNNEVEEEFTVDIYGDYNNDKILDIEDAKKIVDKILESKLDEENGHSIESILDAGNTVYRTGVWNDFTEPHDELINSIENMEEVYKGEEFEVKYSISGFDKDTINGIEGVLNYNKEILELVSVEINKEHGDTNKIYGNINNDGIFAYILDDYNKEDILMTIKFKAKEVGEANISIENILASVNGVSANLEDTIMTNVTVIEAGKGGDEEEPETVTPPQEPETTKPAPVVKESSSYIRPIAYSSDSTIKYLEIKGYKIDFDPKKYDYSIKVKNSVKSLDLTVVLNDSNATYEVFGNENFKVGENTVKIVVTAEDGSTSTYTINVEREKAKEVEKEEEKEKKSSKTIIIILIILVIIGLIYVIFKDDEEEEKK